MRTSKAAPGCGANGVETVSALGAELVPQAATRLGSPRPKHGLEVFAAAAAQVALDQPAAAAMRVARDLFDGDEVAELGSHLHQVARQYSP